MISKDRQLEIAKECGLLTYGAEPCFIDEQLLFASAIEAEVIASMEPVYQCMVINPRNKKRSWMELSNRDSYEHYKTAGVPVRILYRLPEEHN
jgi:hypothetical protein